MILFSVEKILYKSKHSFELIYVDDFSQETNSDFEF